MVLAGAAGATGLKVLHARGYKGQGKRTGKKRRLRFEGGQMPLYRRIPKRGFRTFFSLFNKRHA